jgi:hypothetical protein
LPDRRLAIHLAAGRLNLGGQGITVGDTSLIRVTNRSGSKSTLVRVEKMASQVYLIDGTDHCIDPPAPSTGHHGKPFTAYNRERSWSAATIGLFAAYADFGASFAFGRLLALKTKHGVSSLGVVFYIIVLVLVDRFFTAEQSF